MQSPEAQALPKRRCWIHLPQAVEMLPAEVVIDDKFTVDHIAKVLRLKVGDNILAIDDNRAVGYISTLQTLSKNSITLTLETLVSSPEKSVRKVILAAGLIKDSHWEWLLQKATELGVSEIIPLKTKYCDIQDRMVKPERWQQIIKAAALQSERLTLPQVSPLTELSSITHLLPEQTSKLLLQERSKDIPSLLSLSQTTTNDTTIIIAIGPEGGWHADELTFLQQAGFQPVSLGPQVLRAETAAIAALSCLLCN